MADACQDASRWACVYTHPQAERWADSNLRRLGYRTYLPLVPVRRRDRVLRSLWHTVELPAFPRYLFIRHAPGSPVSPIVYAPGVARIVGKDGQKPDYAPEAAVEAVQAALAAAGSQTPANPQWRPGEAVRLVEGPLAGNEGIVLEPRGYFVRLSLMLGNALATVMVTENYLARRD